MRVVAIFALLVLVAAAAEVTQDNGVLVLNNANFDEVIAQNEFILVEFYAPWCGHCKKLAPEYERAAATLKGLDKPVPLAKVDATENEELGKKFAVQGYPTIKFFTNGVPIEYNGGRTDKEIVSWIQKKVGHVSTNLADQAALDKFVAANPVAVIYFGDSESDAHWGVYKSTALSNDKLAFAHTFSKELTAAQNTQSGKLVIFKNFDEKRNDYEGEYEVAAIKAWLDEKSFATVMEFDDRAIEKVFQQSNPTIFLFHTKTEASASARANFESAAKELKGGKVIFSVSQPDDGHGHFNRLAEYLGVNLGSGNSNVPQIMLIHASQDISKFAYSGDFSTASVKQFVQNYLDGKLTKFLKSEEIPTTQEHAVRVVVGKNFDEEVINNNKDVLVKFYAPWCGHCKTLAPVWEEAAAALAGNKNVIIAKVDSTLNEVEGINIRGFPTLKFFPGNDKKNPVDYEGERTKEGIIAWLKEKATHPWVEASESTGSANTHKGGEEL